MPFGNYEELQESIADYLARRDLQSNIIDFIRLAEIRAQRELHLRFTQKQDTGTLVAGQDFHTWPTDLLEPIDMVILSDPRQNIEIVAKPTLEVVRQHNTSNTPMAGYNRGLVLELAPTPVTALNYELIYWAGITALSNSNTSNWLLDNAPDMLLYGALLEAEPFIGADERIQVWLGAYDRSLNSLKRQEARARMGGGILRVRPDTFA